MLTIRITKGDGVNAGKHDGWTITATIDGRVVRQLWTAGGKRDANNEAARIRSELSIPYLSTKAERDDADMAAAPFFARASSTNR